MRSCRYSVFLHKETGLSRETSFRLDEAAVVTKGRAGRYFDVLHKASRLSMEQLVSAEAAVSLRCGTLREGKSDCVSWFCSAILMPPPTLDMGFILGHGSWIMGVFFERAFYVV